MPHQVLRASPDFSGSADPPAFRVDEACGISELPDVAFVRGEVHLKTGALAAEGVYVGTSSWKYPGWCGLLYDEQKYVYRGSFA